MVGLGEKIVHWREKVCTHYHGVDTITILLKGVGVDHYINVTYIVEPKNKE